MESSCTCVLKSGSSKLSEYLSMQQSVWGNISIERTLQQPKPPNCGRPPDWFLLFLKKKLIKYQIMQSGLVKSFTKGFHTQCKILYHFTNTSPMCMLTNLLFILKATVIILFVMQVQFKVTIWVILSLPLIMYILNDQFRKHCNLLFSFKKISA